MLNPIDMMIDTSIQIIRQIKSPFAPNEKAAPKLWVIIILKKFGIIVAINPSSGMLFVFAIF